MDSKCFIIIIVRHRDDKQLWTSSRTKYIRNNITKMICWHNLMNFLNSLKKEDRDPVGFYVMAKLYGEDGCLSEEERYFYAKKMVSISSEEHALLETSVGYVISPWSEEFLLNAIEEEE